jgi:hypothetical protein
MTNINHNSWIFQNQPISELPPCVGFVYKITNLTNDKSYIGKKLSHFTKTSQITFTTKLGTKKIKKIKSLIPSDWQSYYSSSLQLQDDVKLLGTASFTREILLFCQSKGELSYREAEMQFLNQVLLNTDKWYNGIINCKIHKSHLKSIHNHLTK